MIKNTTETAEMQADWTGTLKTTASRREKDEIYAITMAISDLKKEANRLEKAKKSRTDLILRRAGK